MLLPILIVAMPLVLAAFSEPLRKQHASGTPSTLLRRLSGNVPGDSDATCALSRNNSASSPLGTGKLTRADGQFCESLMWCRTIRHLRQKLGH